MNVILKCLFVVLLSIAFSALSAQPVRLEKRQQDSLWAIWKDSGKHDTVRLKSIDKLIYSFIRVDKDSCLKLVLLELDYALKCKNYLYIGNAYYFQGFFSIQKGDYENSEKNYRLSLQNYELAKYDRGIASALNGIGNCFLSRSDYVNGIEYYVRASKTHLKASNKGGYASAMANIGSTYYSINEYANAYLYYWKSAEIYEELKQMEDLAMCYDDIGTCMIEFSDTTCKRLGIDPSNKLDSALALHTKSLKILLEVNYLPAIPVCYNAMAQIYLRKKMYDKAFANIDSAIAVAKTTKDITTTAYSYNFLSTAYFAIGKFESAIEYGKKALDLSTELGIVSVQYESSYSLYKAYNALGKGELALPNLENYLLLKDSLSKDESRNAVIRKSFQFEADKAESIRKADEERNRVLVEAEKTRQRYILLSVIVGLVFVVVFAGFIFRSLRVTRKQKEIIEIQKTLVERQKDVVEEKQKEITDSINYAKRIQYSLLAHDSLLNDNLSEYFVLFKPKDIVSGDFYWATQRGDSFYLACCDSTGHGVPGAFMSLLNISFLNEAINEKNISLPNEILNHVRQRLIENMEGGQDGMDATLVHFEKNRLTYAAAHNNPILIRDKILEVLPADKMPVGKGELINSFALQEITTQKNDVLYFFTDGFSDQFGGPKGKKFKYSQLKETLLGMSELKMEDQKKILEETFETWKGNLEQVDDVLIIGIRVV